MSCQPEASRLMSGADGAAPPSVRYVVENNGGTGIVDRIPAADSPADHYQNEAESEPITSGSARLSGADFIDAEGCGDGGSVDGVQKTPSPISSAMASYSGGGGGAGGSGKRAAGKAFGVQIKDPPLTETRSYYRSGSEDGKATGMTGGMLSTKLDGDGHGPLHRAIPVMPLGLAILCCVLNIVVPGSGTMISAFSVFCQATKTKLASPLQAFVVNLIVGVLQLATFIVIVGWIWSILWGMTFIQLALSSDSSQSRRGGNAASAAGGAGQVPYYVRRHSSVVV